MSPETPPPSGLISIGDDEYYVQSVREGEQYSEAIINGVAIRTNQNPRRMTSLATVIDPEAIDSLYESSTADAQVAVEFEYEGCHIVVDRTKIYVGEPANG